MIPQPPPGQGPVDPRSAIAPPPAPPSQPGMYPAPQPQPQPPMYPMMMPPPPGFGPPPRRSGAGKTVLLVLMFVLLCISILVNLLLLGGSAMGGGSSTIRETVVNGSDNEKIALVPISGIIDSNMSRQVGEYLRQAENDKSIKAIIVEIDSPGGTVTASDEIYDRLMRFKQDRKIPVVVSMGSLATSGGYYAACAGDYLFAQQTTLTGNIGVLMPRFNLAKLMDKWGIEENTIISEGAKYKNAGSTFSPEQPHETKYLQGIADSMFTRFKDVVKTARAGQIQKLGSTVEQVADGRAFTAAEAKANGLVDDIGYLSEAVAHASKTAGLSNPHVFRYNNPPSLLELFSMRSSVPAGAAGGMTINGINVNVDRKLLDELAAPRVLYLWRGD